MALQHLYLMMCMEVYGCFLAGILTGVCCRLLGYEREYLDRYQRLLMRGSPRLALVRLLRYCVEDLGMDVCLADWRMR